MPGLFEEAATQLDTLKSRSKMWAFSKKFDF
jgi:hypothetical protein